MHPPISLTWHSIELFDERFRTNLAALSGRDKGLAIRLGQHVPASAHFIAAQGDSVFLGRSGETGIETIPDPLPPPEARRLLSSIFSNGHVGWPLLIGGLAYGWAWDRISKLPCKVDGAPGHKPPVYLLTADLDQLWAVLHVMDWQEMLSNPRFVIIAGPDAVEQLTELLVNDFSWPRPKASIRIESALWAGEFNTLMQSINEKIDRRIADIKTRLSMLYPPMSPESWGQKLAAGGPLRILGVTSRFTTFLQYSMRDWLAGFEQLGHETRLVMESADHLISAPPAIAQAVAEYKPDLIVIIDHCRSELGLLPDSIPCVMYAQDRLPNIFNAATGQGQGPLDYVLGFGRLHLSSKFGYPVERFLSAPVGINERRFARSELTDSEIQRFGCEVSYVGNASRPPADVMREHARKSQNPQIERLFEDLFQRMEAWYAAGGYAFSEIALRGLLGQSMQTVGVQLDEKTAADIVTLFHFEVNNPMFRHQTLHWVADAGVNLHLWGKGWEAHPRFAKYARGVADNQRDLPTIYRASKINLQVTPHGSVHQRLIDGLAAGGFFLLRWHPGDSVGRMYRQLLSWCQTNGIAGDQELHARADQRIKCMIARINLYEGSTPENRMLSVFDVMTGHADTDFMAAADGIWPEYESVSFRNGGELESKLVRFLADEPARHDISRSMRGAVIERCAYVNINRRLIDLMRGDSSLERAKCAA
ncbi:MAG TPA: hypothetical protein VIM11_00955 [Tepidisphaeraceae bacterium]|jgi:hypothetical protein